MKFLIQDIRFWIVVLFIIRLIGITNPPLEVEHNWRQTTVTMVARNFVEYNNSILYPRIDIAGEKTGITGMEFPILNYLIYLISIAFGYAHWYGRLINLLVTSIGLYYFYLLIKKYFSEHQAFFSTVILSVSIWFEFSRKIMPDTFAMSLMFAALYYGLSYLYNDTFKKKAYHLIAYGTCLLIGILSKLPTGYLLVIFAIPILDKKISLKSKTWFSAVSIIGLIPVFAWYYIWVPHLVEEYKFWHFFMGDSFSQGLSEIKDNMPQTLFRFYDTALKYSGFALFLYGIIHAFIKQDKKILAIFILASLSFSIIIIKAGFTFPHHNYYIIPFVPIMALVAGYGLTKISIQKITVVILIIISVEGILNQQHDFKIHENAKFLMTIEKDMDKVSNRSDLFLINSGKFPTPMYYTHRKGWIATNESINDKEYLLELQSKGLKYILILKHLFGKEMIPPGCQKILETEDYCLFKL